jgi:hypothetical protein
MVLAVTALVTLPQVGMGQTAAQAIIAYRAKAPVSLDGVVSPGEWNDTPLVTEPTSGITYAVKHNGTGLLFLLEWQASSTLCFDEHCYGGIEIGNLNNTGAMGAPSTPTIMLLLSQSLKGGYDEFISTGYGTQTSVEQEGYATQSTCGFRVSNGTYTGECYRPFHLTNASPYDPFPSLAAGSPIEIAFAVGEFSQPGLHAATDMSTYTLSISNQTYTGVCGSTFCVTSTSSTSISSTVSSMTGATTESQSSQLTTQSSGPLAGFPGLNLVTLYVFAGVALLMGILLGIGVALRAKKLVAGK